MKASPPIYAPAQEPLNVLYQDDDLLVLSKPSGLLSVPGKAPELADCLEMRAKDAYPQALLVHRLDMETSGVFIMAMNKAAQAHLGKQFEKRKTAKTYIARVAGTVETDAGTVDLPLRCDWENRPRQMVCHEHGKAAQTDWQVVHREGDVTRLELTPITGRSHQLRVHCAALGHAILGDPFYAQQDAFEAADRLQLHAESLEIYHPTGGGARMRFDDACPF